MIIGTNKTEYTYLPLPELETMDAMTEAELEKRLKPALNDSTRHVIDAYRRIYPNAKPIDLLIDINTQRGAWINSITLAERKAALRRGPVYMYNSAFNLQIWGGTARSPHGGETPFVFDNTDTTYMMTGGTAEARALAAKMSAAWISFA